MLLPFYHPPVLIPFTLPKAVKLFRGVVARAGDISKNVECGHLNLMVMNPSNLSILHSFCILGSKAEKGSRSTFFPISPGTVFESWNFFTPSPCRREKDKAGFQYEVFLKKAH